MKFPTCFSRYGLSPAPPAAWRSHSAKNVQIWAAPRHPSLCEGCSWKTHKEFPCAIPWCVGGPGALAGPGEILSALLCTIRNRKKSLCPLHSLTLIHTTSREEPQHRFSLFLLKGRPVLPGKKHTSEVIPNKKSGLSWEQRKNILVIFLIQLKVLRCTKVCPGSLARRVHLGPVLGAVCVQVLQSAALLLPCNSVS